MARHAEIENAVDEDVLAGEARHAEVENAVDHCEDVGAEDEDAAVANRVPLQNARVKKVLTERIIHQHIASRNVAILSARSRCARSGVCCTYTICT